MRRDGPVTQGLKEALRRKPMTVAEMKELYPHLSSRWLRAMLSYWGAIRSEKQYVKYSLKERL